MRKTLDARSSHGDNIRTLRGVVAVAEERGIIVWDDHSGDQDTKDLHAQQIRVKNEMDGKEEGLT